MNIIPIFYDFTNIFNKKDRKRENILHKKSDIITTQ